MKIDQMKSRLMADPDWQSLTAYEMTKRVCADMTRDGEKVPSWTAIRDIIGKGSANDINRAKDDFRKEHGEDLRKMSGFVEGVPPELSPHIQGFWTAAVAYVKREYAAHEKACAVAVDAADLQASLAEQERQKAVRAADLLKAQIEGLQQAHEALKQSLVSEQATREQAERLLQAAQAEQVAQREQLMGALTQSQSQLSEAITRLEGVENHALRQVQEARDDAKKKVDAAEAKLKGQAGDHVIELARVNRQLREAQSLLSESAKKIALLEQDNENLRERAMRAEAAVDRLPRDTSGAPARKMSLRAQISTASIGKKRNKKRDA
ncbi:DNA-binding protein [Pseudomonas savastanoi]|uniref:DNA-binding protein n=1 Tax=Pseudomonas savastanoi TaxID=29438 RepID=UPI001782D6D6|nr:DNA-binding protein [Pseudomonas savastanoi]QOI07938.1 hypothetical protein D5S10_29890 [Pseudomonas savastanoi]